MNESLESSLIQSVSSDKLTDLGTSISEQFLDTMIKDEDLKDIPIIGSLIKLYSVGKGIRNYYYIRKVYNFLFSLADIPHKKRVDFIKKISRSDGRKKEFGETIMLLLERNDNLKKPFIIGNIINALINHKLEYQIALRMCSMIDKCYYPDLEFLRNYSGGIPEKKYVAESLASVGFLDKKDIDYEHVLVIEDYDSSEKYTLSKFGKYLKEYGFKNV